MASNDKFLYVDHRIISADQAIVRLGSKTAFGIYILGASFPHDFFEDEEYHDFDFIIRKDEENLIILQYNSQGIWHTKCLLVSWKNEQEPYVHFGKSFIGPVPIRLYQKNISISLDDITYTNNDEKYDGTLTDPDLMCKFLIGHITAEEFKLAAGTDTETEEESVGSEQSEVEILRARIKSAEELMERQGRKLDALCKCIDTITNLYYKGGFRIWLLGIIKGELTQQLDKLIRIRD